ncbi:rhodanese-like domain-containing protein [Streptomyces europaeiscabiei]|nr:rhodanese-like domain-containing protein [Streptomyces europaeiscabiei]MDX3782804.1 rhodanese-like domain-containing protein [Streptomyces europaeiscabiei]MDX3835180.1 rhodanese-like domain-containing protein [Streptomyces europaeiscabiei]
MYFVDTIEVPGLGNRSYLAGGPGEAVAVDPPRDIDRMIAAAARRAVRIAYVVETHVHNDYVSGGPELARLTGAAYLVPAGARVAQERVPVHDGDTVEIDAALALRAVATPGHTPHHTAYVLEEGGVAVAAFTGGSLLIGTVGRPDLVEPRLTAELARAQHTSAHRLADALPDDTAVLPTHGFGSFCSAGRPTGGATTIGRERAGNDALVKDADTFVAELLAGLDDVPAYYAHMGPANARGPAPVDLTPPAPAGPEEIAARLAAGEWVVDLRHRVAFAEGHVDGAVNFEAEGQLATYLAWLLPWGRPVTLLAESPTQLAYAQRELVRVGIDRPAAAATGSPADWLREGEPPRTFPRGTFAGLAEVRAGGGVVVLDVRRASERAADGHITGSVHIPVHQLRDRLSEIPDGTVWVHCAGGMRAAIAASLLDAAGRRVVAIDDGFAAAAEAGPPLTHATPAAGPRAAHTAPDAGSPTAHGTRATEPPALPAAPPAEPPTTDSLPAAEAPTSPATPATQSPAPRTTPAVSHPSGAHPAPDAPRAASASTGVPAA